MKKQILMLFCMLLTTAYAIAQNKTVSGVVLGTSDNQPVVGASVVVVGNTKVGTSTNAQGKYTISVPSSAKSIMISAVGYTTQTLGIPSNGTLNVGLESKNQELEGVVVTALGIKREKKSLGYAAQEVKGDLLSQSGQQNAVSALSGNVAGVQVTAPSTMGGSSRIVLRGVGSVTGNNRPLIVVDGIPLDNSNYNSSSTQRGGGGRDYGDASFDVNPNDIENVTVLKGGPAAALYGSRGNNGVILYTTKSGKNGKSEISFNTGVTLESVYIMPNLQRSYGGGASDKFSQQVINGKTYNIADYVTDESWGPRYDPNLKYLPWNAFDPEFPNDYLKEVPWVAPKNDVRSFFNTGVTYNNNIALTKSIGGHTNVRLSYGNNSIKGILPNSNLSKNTVSINLNSKLTDKLTMEAFSTYTLTQGFNRPEQGYSDNSVSQKFFQWGQRQLDFSVLKDYKLPSGKQRTWNRTSWDDATPKYSDNPYWTAFENTSNDKRSRLFGNVGLNYALTDHLSAIGKVYLDTYSLAIQERVAVGSQAQSSYSNTIRNFSEYNYEGRLQYNNNLGKDFSIVATLGANRRQNRYSSLIGTTIGGLVIPNLYNLANSAEQARAIDYMEQLRINSVFGLLSLGYKDTYFIESTARQDWFSTVTKPGFYPSVSGSVVVSNLIKYDWLSFAKIRGGYSRISSAEGPYRLNTYFTSQIPFNGDIRYLLPTSQNNPNLRPEFKTTSEVGLEARFLKNRIGVDLSLYSTVTTDLITPLEVSPSTGFTSTLINGGKLRNRGVEVTLSGTPIQNDNFQWDVIVNFAKNDNKLLELYQDVKTLQLGAAPFRATLVAQVGQRYGQIFGRDYVYQDGKKVINSDGLYAASPIKALGSIIPDYNMGIRNNFKYKNFSLSALLDIQKGGHYFSTSHMWGMYAGMLEGTAANGIRENGVVLDGVVAQKDASGNTTYVKNTKNVDALTYSNAFYNTVDAQNVFDASYFKLREVTFGYTFPKPLFNGAVKNVSISAFARNLLVWGLAWKGMDPEQASYGSGNIQGLEGGSLPSTRTYGLNLQFKF